jgi:hypothetical protein
MVLSTWAELTAGLDDRDLALLSAFRQTCLPLPGTEERVHRTEVQYRVARIYAVGFVRSHRLEVAVDLLHEVAHPLLRQAFATTRTVVTHRLAIESLDDLPSVVPLLEEAHATVGPGTR